MTGRSPALAARARQTPVAATLEMTARARQLRVEGHDVIALTIGEPDFQTPDHAIEAGFAAARRGETRYPPVDGTAALKTAIQAKFKRDSGLDFALDEIMVGNGAKQVIFNAFMATLDAGDEVVIPAPYWAAYPLMVRLLGGKPVPVACPEATGFKLGPAALSHAITPRTRWVVLNFPNNPSGAACNAEELAALAAVLLRHPHVWILSDDIYEHLVHAPGGHATLAAVEPRLRDRVLTVSGVSKTYAMTGWRIGFGAGPRALIAAMVNMQGQATAGVSTVGQAAAAAAMDGPQELVAERAAIYRQRRDWLVDRLNGIQGLRCHWPEGAFYVFPNISGCLNYRSARGRWLDTDTNFAMALLEEAHVAVVQGAAFGMSPHVRISYATSQEQLAEACQRIELFCGALQ